MDNKFKQLQDKLQEAKLGGGQARIEKQHEKGKLTARERVHFLLDEDSFEEIGALVTHRSTDFGMDKQKILGDGVVTGYGTVGGRLVYVFAQDFTVFGGSLSETHAEKICKVMDLAVQKWSPADRVERFWWCAYTRGGEFSWRIRRYFLPECAGKRCDSPNLCDHGALCWWLAVYSPAMTDFILMVENTSYMVVTGPNVVKTVTNEEVTSEELGGASAHATKSGVTHFNGNQRH